MTDANTSRRGVVLASVSSLVLALIALVTFVLPAEYGIDPLGVGEALGVKGMAGYTVSALSAEGAPYQEDSVAFPLAPFESVEYKYHLHAGEAMVFSWQSEDEVVFDFHSEEEGTDPEDAVTFAAGRDKAQHGTYVAPFSGIHGWFWENRTQGEVTVRLQTRGFYDAASTFSSAGEHIREFER